MSKLNNLFLPRRNFFKSIILLIVALLAFIPFQNCSTQNLEFSQVQIPTEYAYIYGDSEIDQQLLIQKLSGYEQPSLSQIFNQWSRISGEFTYQNVSEIQVPSAFSFCQTSLDSNGNWAPAIDPINLQSISNPGKYNRCIDSKELAALSWSYLESIDSLKCSLNANYFVGFVSAVPFSVYENEAVLTSSDVDDDSIALIIASVKDSENNVHALAAVRNQSGNDPQLGWGIVYYLNGAQHRVYHNVSVGEVIKTTTSNYRSPYPISQQGWSNKKTLVKVIRNENLITAYTSEWSYEDANLSLSDQSKIELDISDESLGLSVFSGPQKYGYGTRSQFGASFSKVKFKTSTSVNRIYDLKRNEVYELSSDGSGRYVKVPGSPFSELGDYKNVINPETQKVYFLKPDKTFEEVVLK